MDERTDDAQRPPVARHRLLVLVGLLALACTGGSMDRVDGMIGENARALQRGNLVVSHRELTDEELARLLADARVPPLSELTLDDNALGSAAADTLATSDKTAGLEVLQLGHNALGDAGAVRLAHWPRLAELRGLYLAANGIGAEGAAALAGAGLRIEHLELAFQPLGDASADALARLGADKLHLRDVGLSGRGARKLLAGARARHLVLDGNPIGRDESGPGLVGLSRIAPSVLRLSLEEAGLTDADARALASVSADGLRALSLSRNPIGDEGLTAIAGAPWLADLQALEITGTAASARGREALRRAWGDRRGLTIERDRPRR